MKIVLIYFFFVSRKFRNFVNSTAPGSRPSGRTSRSLRSPKFLIQGKNLKIKKRTVEQKNVDLDKKKFLKN